MTVEELFQEFDREQDQLLREFFEFLRIPSISSEPNFKKDVLRCASWVEQLLKSMGAKTDRWTGDGHPVIYAEILTSPEKPTLLIYQHYDVQPVDPLEAWISPPFEPTIRDGEIFARGAQDNKGQCFYTLAAIRSLLKKDPSALPNLKFLIEGEEETGSEVLGEVLPKYASKLKADSLIVADVSLKGPDTPSITLGARGMITMTLHLTGSSTDMHSGGVGGVVFNPNRAIAKILASLHDENHRVTVPGFYDDVREPSPEELAQFDLTFDEARFRHAFEAVPTGGEPNYAPTVRAWMRPTLEINGVGGGYTGAGFKTVIPATALAKISCRLVPNQQPEKIAELVRSYILGLVPKEIRAELQIHHGFGKPLRTDPNTPIAKIAEQAFSEVFDGKPCSKILTGGSIPIISELAEASGADTVFLGYGLDTDAIHAPNEHFGVDRLRRGYATMGRLIQLAATR